MIEPSTDLTKEMIAAIRRQVACVLKSETFAKSLRLQRFLEFVVDETIKGRGNMLGQHHIAQKVFDRDESFDPTIDAIVRVEASRLRSKLREFYVEEAPPQTPVITLGKGGYAAQFAFGEAAEDEPSDAGNFEQEAILPETVDKPTIPLRISHSPTIVVLPFLCLNADRELEYLSDGLCEDLTTDLSRVAGLRVIARQSAFAYKDAQSGIRKIAEELGTDYVVEGSIRKAAGRLRINIQLIDASTDMHLWAARKDVQLDDVFSAQDQISQQIASILRLALQPKSRAPTSAIEAYDYVLLGTKEARPHTQEAIARSNYCFERAIELDPGYAVALARLSFNRVVEWILGWPVTFETSVKEGMNLATHACELDTDSALSQAALSWALVWSGQHEQAVKVGRLAHSLDRNNVDVLARLALTLSWTRHSENAFDLLKEAKVLNPMERYDFPMGVAHFMQDNCEQAITSFEASLALHPNFLPALLYLGACYGLLEETHPRIDIPARISRISPTYRLDDDRRINFLHHEDRQRFVGGLRAIGFA